MTIQDYNNIKNAMNIIYCDLCKNCNYNNKIDIQSKNIIFVSGIYKCNINYMNNNALKFVGLIPQKDDKISFYNTITSIKEEIKYYSYEDDNIRLKVLYFIAKKYKKLMKYNIEKIENKIKGYEKND